MDTKIPQEKPNYALHYKADFSDDWINNEYHFNANDDNHAREMALSFVEEHNIRHRQEIDAGVKSSWYGCIYKPLRLERINYVVKEIEERTPISLQGDVASRVRNGAPVELSELANL